MDIGDMESCCVFFPSQMISRPPLSSKETIIAVWRKWVPRQQQFVFSFCVWCVAMTEVWVRRSCGDGEWPHVICSLCALVEYVKTYQKSLGRVIKWRCLLGRGKAPHVLVLYQLVKYSVVLYSLDGDQVSFRRLGDLDGEQDLPSVESLFDQAEESVWSSHSADDSVSGRMGSPPSKRKKSRSSRHSAASQTSPHTRNPQHISLFLTRLISRLVALPLFPPTPTLPFSSAELNFLILQYLRSLLPHSELISQFEGILEGARLLPQRMDWRGLAHSLSMGDLSEMFSQVRALTLPQMMGSWLHHVSSDMDPHGNPSALSRHSFKQIASPNQLSKIPHTSRSPFIPSDVSLLTPSPLISTPSPSFLHSTSPSYVPNASVNNVCHFLQSRQRFLKVRRQPFSAEQTLFSSFRHAARIRGHRMPVYCLTFDKTSQRIISASDDRLIKVGHLVFQPQMHAPMFLSDFLIFLTGLVISNWSPSGNSSGSSWRCDGHKYLC
jgi:hypothetical protein